MKYWKNLQSGAVKAAAEAPKGALWREATEREYRAYREYLARAMGNLEKAVARKARLLGE